MNATSPLTDLTTHAAGDLEVLLLAYVPELAFALQLAAASGAVALRAKRRSADIDTWRIARACFTASSDRCCGLGRVRHGPPAGVAR